MRVQGLALACAASCLSQGLSAADLDVILYGAYGCVGHFAAGHLAQQPGLKWAVAGRTEAKLKALVAALDGPSSEPEIIVSPLDDTIASWVTRAKAVVTAAGPYSIHGGEFLVKACAENGVHYTDTSDEFYWQREMVDGYDSAAQASGARVVLSSGFCVLAGDLGSQLAMRGLGELGGTSSPAVKLDAWLERYNGGLSAGVINTGKAIANASYPKEWDSDPYVLAPNVSQDLRLDQKVTGMSYPGFVGGEGVIVGNLFGPYDARLLRRTFAHLGQAVELRVGATPLMYSTWTGFLAEHPGSWTNLSKCPTESVFSAGSWRYRFKASGGGKSKEVLLSGSGDPGYKFTAYGIAEAGLCLSGKTPNCLLEPGAGGVFTSMSTMDPEVLQRRLVSIGLLKVGMADTEAMQV